VFRQTPPITPSPPVCPFQDSAHTISQIMRRRPHGARRDRCPPSGEPLPVVIDGTRNAQPSAEQSSGGRTRPSHSLRTGPALSSYEQTLLRSTPAIGRYRSHCARLERAGATICVTPPSRDQAAMVRRGAASWCAAVARKWAPVSGGRERIRADQSRSGGETETRCGSGFPVTKGHRGDRTRTCNPRFGALCG
jgi:hypothetical protein